MLHRQPMKIPPALEQLFQGFHARPSKHVAPFKGKVRLNSNSSLRKLMRASRRGKLPDGRAVLIEQTQAIAARHPTLHMSPAAKRRYLASKAAA